MLAATILASAMAFIDATIVTIALPSMQVDLDANFLAIQWVVNAYASKPTELIRSHRYADKQERGRTAPLYIDYDIPSGARDADKGTIGFRRVERLFEIVDFAFNQIADASLADPRAATVVGIETVLSARLP